MFSHSRLIYASTGPQRDEQAARRNAQELGAGQRRLQRAAQPPGRGQQVLQRPHRDPPQVPEQSERLRVRAQNRKGGPHERHPDEHIASELGRRRRSGSRASTAARARHRPEMGN